MPDDDGRHDLHSRGQLDTYIAQLIGENTAPTLIRENTEATLIGENAKPTLSVEKTEAKLVPTLFETSSLASEGNDKHDTVTKPSHKEGAIQASHCEAASTSPVVERSEGHPRKPEAQDNRDDANFPTTTQPSPRISLADRPAHKNTDSKTKTADFVQVALDAHLAVKQSVKITSDPVLRDVIMRKHRAGKKATYSQLMQKFSGLSSQEGNYDLSRSHNRS